MAESSPHALDASGHKTAGADDLRDHFMSLHAEEGIGAIPLRSLSRHVPLLLAPDCSIRNALIALNSAASDAGLVAPGPAAPLGIVTVRHLVDAITLHNGTLDDPVIAFMTGAPPSLPADAPVHRARVLLTRSRCSHLLLLENDGQCSRLISQAEIPGFREGGGDVLAKTIGTAGDIASLAVAAGEIRRRGAELFAAGMGVETLCQWMSGLNDLLSLRLIELVAEAFDLPPVPWCWLVFGSEGRLEQTFTTDQDNGLIFLSDEAAEEEDVRLAFLPFAQEVNRALDRCGFALCRGNIMAGNRRWCLSLRECCLASSTVSGSRPSPVLRPAAFSADSSMTAAGNTPTPSTSSCTASVPLSMSPGSGHCAIRRGTPAPRIVCARWARPCTAAAATRRRRWRPSTWCSASACSINCSAGTRSRPTVSIRDS